LRSGVKETAEFSGDLYFVDLAMSMNTAEFDLALSMTPLSRDSAMFLAI
jgi:hypothetical protein